MSEVKITFLAHSGFSVETENKVLIFDYYQDPKGIVSAYYSQDKPLWFFVSHRHGDHFNPAIGKFVKHAAYYIVNDEVPLVLSDSEKMRSMKVYDTITVDDVSITQYGSTDEGGSFFVRTNGYTFFHAGDLNWWHWMEDTDENNKIAKMNFQREMEHLQGMQVDIAFFPVDARLGAAREWGIKGFLQRVTITKGMIPMHYFGSSWSPSQSFLAQYQRVPLWIPQKEGEERVWC